MSCTKKQPFLPDLVSIKSCWCLVSRPFHFRIFYRSLLQAHQRAFQVHGICIWSFAVYFIKLAALYPLSYVNILLPNHNLLYWVIGRLRPLELLSIWRPLRWSQLQPGLENMETGASVLGSLGICSVPLCCVPHKGTQAVSVGQLSGLSCHHCFTGPEQLCNICSDGNASGKLMPWAQFQLSCCLAAPTLLAPSCQKHELKSCPAFVDANTWLIESDPSDSRRRKNTMFGFEPPL